ncbi:MAG: LptF/LptG family permease [Armatimonadota bacterium]|nr:LptF/LptG family permease [Armatimonadota bacterium]
MVLRLHDRYFLREILNPLLISLTAFMMMMILQLLYGVVDLLTSHQFRLGDLGLYIFYKLPMLAQWSLPVALLVGSSLAISRMSHDSELVPMRVGGLPLWRFLIPLAFLGLFFSVLSQRMGETITPPSDHKAEAIHRKLTFEGEVAGLKPDTLFRSDDRIFYFHLPFQSGTDHTVLQGVVIYQLPDTNENGKPRSEGDKVAAPSRFWTAEHADVLGQTWRLTDVREHQVSSTGETVADVPRPPMQINLKRNIQFFLSNQQTPQEMTAAEISSRIEADEHLSLPDSVILPLKYEYYFRLALPFACLVFSMVSAPLTLRFGRGGSLIGMLVSFGVLFFYYDAMMIAQKLAMSGAFSPALAAWIPNILFGGLGVFLIVHET